MVLNTMLDLMQVIGYRFVFFLLSLRTALNCWTTSDASLLGVPVWMDQWRRSVLKQCWQHNLIFTGYRCPPWYTEHWLSSERHCLTWTESSEHSACDGLLTHWHTRNESRDGAEGIQEHKSTDLICKRSKVWKKRRQGLVQLFFILNLCYFFYDSESKVSLG